MSGGGSGGDFGGEESHGLDSVDASSDHFEGIAPAVLDALPDIVYVLDTDGRLVDWNDRLEAVTGYDESTLAGRQGISLVSDRDDRALAECIVGVLDDRETVTREVALVTATGETIPHRLTAAPIIDDDEPVGITGTAYDISDQLARERAFEEKNARLERFASIVSHDLRNPLTVADGYLELAATESDAPHLDEIEAAHERMRQLIDDLLALARNGSELDEERTVDLTGVASDAWGVVATENATLHLTDLGTVEGDRSRLRQLFENLFRNSVEHSSTGNRRAERADDSVEHGSTGSRDADERRETDSDVTGETVTVTVGPTDDGFYVADDGPGLPEKVGDPFEDGVSTKSEGTGLGLSIVESIASAHGWTVEASASDSGGARFDIRI